MGNKTAKLIFKILGFTFLAGSLGVIGLGLYYLIPEVETFIYIVCGIGGLCVAIIFLVLALWKFGGGPAVYKERPSKFKERSFSNDHESNTDKWSSMSDTYSRQVPEGKRLPPKEKVKEGRYGTVYCSKCGAENPAGEYYCSSCKSAMKKICKLCGHDNPQGTTVCEGCEKEME